MQVYLSWAFLFGARILHEVWSDLVGGWPTPLKNINQMGWLFPIYANQQPEIDVHVLPSNTVNSANITEKNRYTLVIEHVNGKSSIYRWCSHSNPICIGCSIAISFISIQISNKSDFYLHTKTSHRYGKPNMYRSLSQPETAVVFPYHCVSLPESNCDFQVSCFDPCPVQTSCSFGLPLFTGQRSCDDLRSNRVRWCLDA